MRMESVSTFKDNNRWVLFFFDDIFIANVAVKKGRLRNIYRFRFQFKISTFLWFQVAVREMVLVLMRRVRRSVIHKENSV